MAIPPHPALSPLPRPQDSGAQARMPGCGLADHLTIHFPGWGLCAQGGRPRRGPPWPLSVWTHHEHVK